MCIGIVLRNGGDSLAIVRENERKKEYLKGYIYSVRKAQRLKEQIEELRSQQMFPSANHDGMPQGNAHSDLSGYMARLDALVSQLEAEKEIAIREYNEIYNQVQLMQDEAEKEVLERRYLLGDSWWRIAVKMNYAESQEEYSLVQEQIENGVQANYVNFLTSFTDLRTQEKSVELADQNYNVTSNRYKNDLALLTDMLDASNMKLSADLNLVNARINVVYSFYKMKYITHTL